jgi:hypothetical protein
MYVETGHGLEIDRNHLFNAQTGRIGWDELQRHFARGLVIKVAAGMDLVEVASHVAVDNVALVERWLVDGQMRRAEIDDARNWNARGAEFWAVVSAPWVLVQEIRED